MPVSFWIWSSGAFALSQFLATIFAAGVAGALAASQKAACETPLFSLVRTNGLPGAVARFARTVRSLGDFLVHGHFKIKSAGSRGAHFIDVALGLQIGLFCACQRSNAEHSWSVQIGGSGARGGVVAVACWA